MKLFPDQTERWLHIRPLALTCACFIGGCALGFISGVPAWLWLIIAVLPLLCLAFSPKRVFLAVLVIPLGAALLSLAMKQPQVVEYPSPQSVSGTVCSETADKGGYLRVKLCDVTVNGVSQPCDVMLYLYGEDAPKLPQNTRITLDASVYRLRSSSSLDTGYAGWLWRQHIALCASGNVSNITSLEDRGFSFGRFFSSLRSSLTDRICAVFDDRSAAIVTALVLGDRSMLPEEYVSAFRNAGVSHMLALSGFHVMVLIGCLEYLFKKLRIRRGVADILLWPFLLFYTALTGFTASFIRALLMYALRRTARRFGREYDPLTSLLVTAAVMLVFKPLYIYDVSFLLSFAAVGGIILFTNGWTKDPEKRKKHRNTLLTKLRSAVFLSVAAQLGTLPLAATCFNSIPVLSLLSNLILLPLLTVVYPYLLAITGLACLLPVGAVQIAGLPVKIICTIADFFGSLPNAYVTCPNWNQWLILLYALIMVLCGGYFHPRHNPRRHCFMFTLPLIAALAVLLPSLVKHDGLTITFLDVGQGDAAIVQTDAGTFLVDTGDGSTAANYVIDNGLHIDGIFLSHAHSDHAGGLGELVRQLPPTRLYVSEYWDRSTHDDDVDIAYASAVESGWNVCTLGVGDMVPLGTDVTATVYAPYADTADTNESCMVLGIDYGSSSALFTGDMPMSAELIPLPDCTVLKVPHHGSATSTGELLLSQTTPSAAVISVGHNSYGHPTQEVLDRLSGIPVYRTDICGSITATLLYDGSTIISTGKHK